MVKRGRSKELADIVEQKVTSFVLEMESANYDAEDVALEIDTLIKRKWLDPMGTSRPAQTGSNALSGTED